MFLKIFTFFDIFSSLNKQIHQNFPIRYHEKVDVFFVQTKIISKKVNIIKNVDFIFYYISSPIPESFIAQLLLGHPPVGALYQTPLFLPKVEVFFTVRLHVSQPEFCSRVTRVMKCDPP